MVACCLLVLVVLVGIAWIWFDIHGGSADTGTAGPVACIHLAIVRSLLHFILIHSAGMHCANDHKRQPGIRYCKITPVAQTVCTIRTKKKNEKTDFLVSGLYFSIQSKWHGKTYLVESEDARQQGHLYQAGMAISSSLNYGWHKKCLASSCFFSQPSKPANNLQKSWNEQNERITYP